jgi:branched-chain amino acid transport system ATP-binding protein
MSALEVLNLTSGYGHVEALHEVSLRADVGTAVTVIGPNGAGKTTLLKTIAGLVPARRGQILVDGRDVTRWSAERRVRSGIMLVPEGRHVFARLTVDENLALGAYARRGSAAAMRRRRAGVLDLFPRLAGRSGQRAGTLSGGEQQMLAIGRALVGAPRVLLLDEPSLGLSPAAVADVVDVLATLVREMDRGPDTIVLVEQNAYAAFAVAERGYLLDHGAVTATGRTEELKSDHRVQATYLGVPETATPPAPPRPYEE